jgi:hypothetical protein
MLAQASIHQADERTCHQMKRRSTVDAGLRQHDQTV